MEVDSDMMGECAPSVDLPSKPVLEMALNLETFKREVRATIEAGRTSDLEYVLLKIAMEVQDKANLLQMMR